MQHLILGAMVVKGLGSLLFVLGSSLGAYLLVCEYTLLVKFLVARKSFLPNVLMCVSCSFCIRLLLPPFCTTSTTMMARRRNLLNYSSSLHRLVMLVSNDMIILSHIWNLKFEINDNVISSHTCFQVTVNVGDFFLSTSRIWLYLGHYFFSLAWRIPCQGEHLRRRLLINQKQTKKGSSSFHHFCSVKQLNSRMPTT